MKNLINLTSINNEMRISSELIAENVLQRGISENLPYKIIFQHAKAEVNKFAEMAIPFELEV